MAHTIAIIGASGKVGSATLSHLVGGSNEIRLVARRSSAFDSLLDAPNIRVFEGDGRDTAFLADVFDGVDAVLSMIPADWRAENIPAYQDEFGIAQFDALKACTAQHIVFISSVGAHTEENTGVVAGLCRQERRIAQLTDRNVLILRPSYFMENQLANLGMIKSMGINGSNIDPARSFPVIAVSDIGVVAAHSLSHLDWSGHRIQPLLGSRDVTLVEMTKAMGDAVGKPDLPYVQFADQDVAGAIMAMGASASMANELVALGRGISMGVFSLEVRDDASTTPTSIEDFARNVFAPLYAGNA